MWQPVWLSLRVAVCATLIASVAGTALAWLLARHDFRGRQLLETLVNLPLALPPTVVGFFLLAVVGRNGILGRTFGVGLTFTFAGAVLASVVVAMPLMVQTAQTTLAGVHPDFEEAAALDGASRWLIFRDIILPLSRRGIVAGTALAFSRALGEFGATLMVAGNIPGRTQTMPLAIYTAVQIGDARTANWLVGIMTIIAFVVVWLARRLATPQGE